MTSLHQQLFHVFFCTPPLLVRVCPLYPASPHNNATRCILRQAASQSRRLESELARIQQERELQVGKLTEGNQSATAEARTLAAELAATVAKLAETKTSWQLEVQRWEGKSELAATRHAMQEEAWARERAHLAADVEAAEATGRARVQVSDCCEPPRRTRDSAIVVLQASEFAISWHSPPHFRKR